MLVNNPAIPRKIGDYRLIKNKKMQEKSEAGCIYQTSLSHVLISARRRWNSIDNPLQ